MIAHLKQIFWVLRILIGLKIWPTYIFFLWKKSVYLYASLIAFTDKERSANQLHKAMICALITSVYDYETDEVKRDNNDLAESPYFSLLEFLVKPESEEAYRIAVNLFKKDHAENLSKSGLERGSVAFKFYNLIIASKWMSEYPEEEIISFGRKLQIIDDLIDLKNDRILKEKNCFLIPNKTKEYIQEIEIFLKSIFWKKLKENSWVYRYFERKIKKLIKSMKSKEINLKKELLGISRLHTALHAFVLTFAGYKIIGSDIWTVGLINSVVFTLITSSIMIFNDWVDAESDFKRGKTFVYQNKKTVLLYWISLSSLTCFILTGLAFLSPKVAIFCLAIWLLGILYSYLQKVYVVQNAIVSLCTASPILCSIIYENCIDKNVVLISLSLCIIIFSREILGDMKHKESDRGYKTSIPIKTEHNYPEGVSLTDQISPRLIVPESIKQEIDRCFKFRGEFFESLKVMNTLTIFSFLFLLPVLNYLALIPCFIMLIANFFMTLPLFIANDKCIHRASPLFNLSIISILLMILFI